MTDRCPHENMVWDIGQEFRCDDCGAKAREIANDYKQDLLSTQKAYQVAQEVAIEQQGKIADLTAELAKLRALCAARPTVTDDCGHASDELLDWITEIDAAGRGEGV